VHVQGRAGFMNTGRLLWAGELGLALCRSVSQGSRACMSQEAEREQLRPVVFARPAAGVHWRVCRCCHQPLNTPRLMCRASCRSRCAARMRAQFGRGWKRRS
jgi:hypothetical protein